MNNKNECAKLVLEPTTVPMEQSQNVGNNCRTKFACRFAVECEKGIYLCVICGCKAFSEEAFNKHLQSQCHIKIAQDDGKYVLLHDNDKYYCSRCSCFISEYTQVHEHIVGKRHCLINSEESTEARLNSASQPFVSYPINNVYYCYFCDEDIHYQKIKAHIGDQKHTEAMDRHGRYIMLTKAYQIYCSLCSVILGRDENVLKHSSGKNHQIFLRDKKSMKSISLKPQPIDSSDRFVITKSGKKYCCVCDCTITDDQALVKHLRDKCHDDAVRQHGFYKMPTTVTEFFCNKCECIITYSSEVYRHITGHKHESSLDGETIERSLKPQMIDWDKLEYFVSPFVSHEDTGRYYCLMCDSKIFSDHALKTHLEKRWHKDSILLHGSCISPRENDLYYCHKCECSIPGYTRVYKHIRGKCHLKILYGEITSKIVEKQPIVQSSSNITHEIIDLEDDGIEESLPKEGASSETKKVSSERKRNMEEVNQTQDLENEKSLKKQHLESPDMKKVSSDKMQDIEKGRQIPNLNEEIYALKDKMREIKIGVTLTFETDTQKKYCLICRETIDSASGNYVEHLCAMKHRESLKKMLNDHARFKLGRDELSDFELALQYMEDISDVTTRCLVCNEEMRLIDNRIKSHIDKNNHRERCEDMKMKSTKSFEAVVSQMRCNWYKVVKYQCVPCTLTFDSEIEFVSHLQSEGHNVHTRELEKSETVLIYDFCEICAQLWYGDQSTYGSHCESLTHKWFDRQRYIVPPKLSMANCVAQVETRLNHAITYLENVYSEEKSVHDRLITELRNMIQSKFSGANVCTFGSSEFNRCAGKPSIDIFLSCYGIYDGDTSSDDEVLRFMRSVHYCLKEDPQTWDLQEFFPHSHSTIIKVRHRPTGVPCEIFFESGLVVNDKKLMKFFNSIFPPCHKLLLFLKLWLTSYNWSGHRRISIYALYWLIVFYLQKESRIPSIVSLIATENKSDGSAGQIVGVSDNLACHESKGSCSMKELLIGFFEFYANFDFRCSVASPLIGNAVEKQAFENPTRLPNGMEAYISYLQNSKHPEPFRIDCPMCVQDPFMPQHNLTKAVRKIDLIRFRKYCSTSLDSLQSS